MTIAWGSKTSATQLTSITTEQFFSETPTIEPNQEVHCVVDADFPTTPTDHLIVSVYATLDDTAEAWDDTPITQFQIDNGTDPNQVSFVLGGIYKFRIGVSRSGSTDTITSADFSYRIATLT